MAATGAQACDVLSSPISRVRGDRSAGADVGYWHIRTSGSREALAIHEARSGGGPGKGVLAETGWGDWG
jgi:hypothetical protein